MYKMILLTAKLKQRLQECFLNAKTHEATKRLFKLVNQLVSHNLKENDERNNSI